VGELRPIDEIRIEADGKYWRVTGRRNGGDAEGVVEQPAAPTSGWRSPAITHYDLNDDIPF
jgi:hypothetical protein